MRELKELSFIPDQTDPAVALLAAGGAFGIILILRELKEIKYYVKDIYKEILRWKD